MGYIQMSDITDKVVLAFGETTVSSYFTEVDFEIEDIAEMQGLTSADLIDTNYKGTGRVHYKLIRFGVAWLCYRLLMDRAGVNNVDTSPEMEKYYIKAGEWKRLADRLRSEITIQMFTGRVFTSADRVALAGIMVRS
jgi:hypothetical protein